MKKKISAIICMVIAISMFMCMPVSAAQLGNGEYSAKRTVSYADPATGKTVDGGDNIAFGTSIANNVVEKTLLIEKENGKTYVTIGMGFMEYAGNNQKVDVAVQVNPGDDYSKYKKVSAQKVGSCDNGNCHHLRFEVVSEEYPICVGYTVAQMNREVKFFITPDTSSAVAGQGSFGNRTDGDSMRKTFDAKIGEKVNAPDANYNKNAGKDNGVKKMDGVKKGNNQAANNGQPVNQETTTQVQTTAPAQETTAQAEQVAVENAEVQQSNNTWIWIVVAVVAVVVIGVCVWYFAFYKKKKAN